MLSASCQRPRAQLPSGSADSDNVTRKAIRIFPPQCSRSDFKHTCAREAAAVASALNSANTSSALAPSSQRTTRFTLWKGRGFALSCVCVGGGASCCVEPWIEASARLQTKQGTHKVAPAPAAAQGACGTFWARCSHLIALPAT